MDNKTKDASLTKARVLCQVDIDGKRYEPNDIAELSESDLYLYRKSVDPHPDSVAYAEQLGRREKARRALQSDAAFE